MTGASTSINHECGAEASLGQSLSTAAIQKPCDGRPCESMDLIGAGSAAQAEYALHVKTTEQHAPKLLCGLTWV